MGSTAISVAFVDDVVAWYEALLEKESIEKTKSEASAQGEEEEGIVVF